MPGFGGGANWNGAAFDPETGVLYVPSLTLATRYRLGPPDPARSTLRYGISASIVMAGPFGLPLVKPPWARITAIDMNKGEHLWMVPHGSPIRTMDDLPGDLPEGIKEEVFEDLRGTVLGGAVFSPLLVTKTLLFAGIGRASGSPPRDRPLFQAFDKATGKVVWEIELPSSTTGGPMTYMSGAKQYIAVATGGGRSGPPAKLVALSLP